jgi:hypothetical protein
MWVNMIARYFNHFYLLFPILLGGHFATQRVPLCEVASVRQRDGAVRHDTLDSNDDNLPKAKGGFAPAVSKGLLVDVSRNATIV